jgi:H+/Na+-translocating ferredoxin:NAD+ oxidoreductase subunit G
MQDSSLPPAEKGNQNNLDLAMLRALVLVAGVSGLLVVMVYQITRPIIAENQRQAINRALYKVVPGAEQRHDFIVQGQKLIAADASDKVVGERIYAAYDSQGRLAGVAIEAAGQGYQDVIRVLYGYSPICQCIRGIAVLKLAETPGIGDKIAKDKQFLQNFAHLDASLSNDGTRLAHDIVTVKHKSNPWEIEAITGATISSRAMGRLLNASAQQMLPLIAANLKQLQNADGALP